MNSNARQLNKYKKRKESTLIANRTLELRKLKRENKEKFSKYFILVTGLPSNKDYLVDDIFKRMNRKTTLYRLSCPIDKMIPPSFSKTEMPVKFLLYTKKWFDKSVSTDGNGILYFKEGTSKNIIDDISKNMDLRKIVFKDETYYLSTYVVHTCKKCNQPLKEKQHEKDKRLNSLPYTVDVSSLNKNYCKLCKPNFCCTCCGNFIKFRNPDNYIIIRQSYLCCKTCRDNSQVQEKWRYTVGNHITETKSNYKVRKHLSDKAIEREQRLMGGKPNEPRDMTTPLSYSHDLMDDLLNPNKESYWPYGMSSLEYMRYQEQIRFDNPIIETPYDNTWMDIEITDELLETFEIEKQETYTKYKNENDELNIPDEFLYMNEKFRRADNHGLTCDNSICQAIFQYYEKDGYTNSVKTICGLNPPIYTTRPGNLNGSSRDMGYGYERCLICINKNR